MLMTHVDLKKKIESMEKKYDDNFKIVFEAMSQHLQTKKKPRKKIGYTVKEKQASYWKPKKKKNRI